MEITGNVTWVGAPQKGTSQRTGNAWSKQSFEVEYIGGQYPKRIVLDTLDANIVGKLAIGQKVNVKFDFETREYNGKKYNEVKIWRDGLHAIANTQAAPAAAPQNNNPQSSAAPQAAAPAQQEEELPF